MHNQRQDFESEAKERSIRACQIRAKTLLQKEENLGKKVQAAVDKEVEFAEKNR
ncbi:MAG: hypothetical protein MZV70_77025 [Desulfobacterales bacterium]|nr:hypothetical protein [Desulfobacterales bacterium]